VDHQAPKRLGVFLQSLLLLRYRSVFGIFSGFFALIMPGMSSDLAADLFER
jgi:hypothetical protein